MHLNDIVDSKLLADMIAQKYVKVQSHPEYGYLIYNYTDHAMFDKVWNQATINCRGLITDASGVVIARGMPKFFNYQQDEAPKFNLEDQVHVADKVDGSLGVLYPTPKGGWAIATRGSFTSEQAVWATQFLRENPMGAVAQGWTILFEVVVEWNRIVLNYDTEGLVLLGAVHNESGYFDNLQECVRPLPEGSPRDDGREHEGSPEGLEPMSRVPERIAKKVCPKSNTRAQGGNIPLSAGLVRRESGQSFRSQEAKLEKDTGCVAEDEGRETLHRLWASIPPLLNGLGSRARGKTLQRESSQNPGSIARGVGEMRTCLCKLSSGSNVRPSERYWRATSFGTMTYAEAIALPPRKNAEGLVLTRDWDGAMVKLKQQDYLDLHRIITGLSARSIWQLIVDGKDVDKYIVQLPDEFVDWARLVVAQLELDIADRAYSHACSFEVVVDVLEGLYGEQGWGKKEFALEVMKSVPDESWAMFMLYDGKDLEPTLWKRAKPEAFITPVAQRTEDVA